MNGDAAEEVVTMALNTADISIRLVGAGAKNLAALLVAWAKKEKTHVGKTSLPKLLSSGDELLREQTEVYDHIAAVNRKLRSLRSELTIIKNLRRDIPHIADELKVPAGIRKEQNERNLENER